MLAILLAAGKGQRVGGPKALLDLGGRTALERCHATLRAAGLERLRVVISPELARSLAVEPQTVDAGKRQAADAGGRHGDGAGVVRGNGTSERAGDGAGRARWPGVTWVVNARPELGQTSSLRCALALPDPPEDFVLHTVDHPLVRTVDVRALLAAFATRAPGQALVAPSVGGRRGHPCVHAAALVAEFLALADDEPAHRVIRHAAQRVLHVPLADPWLVRDLDTPEDVASARAALAADPSR